MLTNNSALVTLVLSALLSPIYWPVETAPSNLNNGNDFYQHPVVYRRFVRRRPPMYPDDRFMEEIVEFFDTKEKPPAYGGQDIDEFIFCDFNQHLESCK